MGARVVVAQGGDGAKGTGGVERNKGRASGCGAARREPEGYACKRGRAERHASHKLGSMDLNIMGQPLINVDPSFQHLHISLYCLYRDRIANSAPSPIPCLGRTSTCEATHLARRRVLLLASQLHPRH